MNSIETSVVRILQFQLHIVLLSWSVGFAATSNHCPAGQYLDRNSCVDCTSCQVPNDTIIKLCHGRSDTICGSITDVKSNRIKKLQLPPKNKNQNKPAATENENAFFETVNSYNLMLGGLKPEMKKNSDVATVYVDGKMRPHNSLKISNSPTERSSPRWFDKNGKHMKKDLSSVDENPTSKSSDSSRNSSHTKKSSKPKKTKDEPPHEWKPIIRPDFIHHGIFVEVEPTPPPSEIIPVVFGEKSAENSNVGSHKIKNKIKPLDSDEDDYDASRKPDENIPEDEDLDDIDYDSEDEEEDNSDDENDASEEDEDFDAPFPTDKLKTSKKPFGVEDNLLTNVNDADDDTEEAITRNKYEVNVEPYIDTSNWQLLVLVSAVSACFLFFVVVNAYLCIYMKRWRYMKQDFEAGVEDLSVRINLMQHAGFEAEESNNIRNYITQLRGGKSNTEKVPKTTL